MPNIISFGAGSARGFGQFTAIPASVPIVLSGLMLYLDAGQAASYPGGGTTWTDLSGNNNTGTLVGSPAFSSTFGGGLAFSTSSQYASVANSATVGLIGDMTICTWINIINDFSTYRGICAKSTFNIPNPYDFYCENNTGLPSLFRGNGSTYAFNRGTSAPTTGTPRYLSVTMSGTTVAHYTNAVSNGGGSLTTTITNNTAILSIGARASDGGTYGIGTIYQFQLYNRALSAAEITTNYNAHRARYGL